MTVEDNSIDIPVSVQDDSVINMDLSMEQYIKGDKGDPATVTVGSVTSTDDPDGLSITNSGTESNAILDFVLPRGPRGVQGLPGKDFSIEKTYSSVAEMNADKDNITEGCFVLIVSNVEDEDNSKLFVKTATELKFLTDLSGAQGFKGEAATVQVGTVVSGDAPNVTNSGSENAAILDFVLQKGDKGEAASIMLGSVTTGDPGTNVEITNSGDSTNAVFDFKIPKGTPGTAATVQIGTVAKGPEASVTNTGTSTAAVLNFVIPQGDKGDPFTYEDFTQEQIDEIIAGVVERADYATKDYVDKNGGKIDAILLNGTLLPITEKQVDIPATQVVIKRWAADEII